jgi:small-conductance mechanosensitive channel
MKIRFYLIIFLISLSHFSFSNPDTQTGKNDSIPDQGYPVVFYQDTLFYLSQNLGPFSPEERAKAILKRLDKAVNNYTSENDSFEIVKNNENNLIRFKDNLIMSVTNEDAEALGTTGEELAKDYKDKIQKAFFDFNDPQNTHTKLVNLGYAALTFAGLLILLFAIFRLFNWLDKKIEAYEKKINRKRKSVLRFLMPKGKQSIFMLFSTVAKYILILLVVIFYVPLIFHFLPWARGVVHTFYSYLTAPINYIVHSFLNFLPDLFFIIVIFLLARYVVRVLTTLEEEYEKDNIRIKGFHKDWGKPTLKILKVIIYAFALIFAFPYIPGSNSAAFRGVSIFFGVLLSLGSTSAISNIVAGVVITYMRPFMLGDRVRIGETIGDVIEKTLLVTKIRTLKNEDVTIPNSTIINTHLWNYSRNAKEIGVILYTSITIGYDVPWKQVNKLLIKAARMTSLVQRTPAPFVLQKGLENNFVEYELNVYTKQVAKMQQIYSDLHKNILEVFTEAKVEILSPRYVASRDGNDIAIPGVKSEKQETGVEKNPAEEIIDKITGKNQKPKKTTRSATKKPPQKS